MTPTGHARQYVRASSNQWRQTNRGSSWWQITRCTEQFHLFPFRSHSFRLFPFPFRLLGPLVCVFCFRLRPVRFRLFRCSLVVCLVWLVRFLFFCLVARCFLCICVCRWSLVQALSFRPFAVFRCPSPLCIVVPSRPGRRLSCQGLARMLVVLVALVRWSVFVVAPARFRP